MNENVTAFMNLLETKYMSADGEHKTVDLASKLEFLTMDVISDLAFGEPFGFIRADADIFGYVDKLREAFPIIMLTTAVEPLRAFLHSPLVRGLLPSSTDPAGFGRILGQVPTYLTMGSCPGSPGTAASEEGH